MIVIVYLGETTARDLVGASMATMPPAGTFTYDRAKAVVVIDDTDNGFAQRGYAAVRFLKRRDGGALGICRREQFDQWLFRGTDPFTGKRP